MGSANSEEWRKAMDEEVQSLNDNETFLATTLPKGIKTVGGKWVHTIKTDTDGKERYKAGFVAKSYSHIKGINYETHSKHAEFKGVPKSSTAEPNSTSDGCKDSLSACSNRLGDIDRSTKGL